jgi:ubiquinone/menaquinone biosynthesis C-methylase UbiE
MAHDGEHGEREHAGGDGDHHHKPLVHGFDDRDADEWAQIFEGPERDASQRPAAVVAAMQLAPGMTVADLGAGTGYFLPHLASAVGATGGVIGLDVAPNMVRFMRERVVRERLGNVEIRLVLGDDALLPAASVDRVLIVNTWHHIPDRVAYTKRLVTALREGGSLWIVDFTMAADHGPPKEHRIEAQAVVAELEAAGLRAQIDSTTLPNQYIVSGAR